MDLSARRRVQMEINMKKLIVNIFAITGISLTLLSIIALFFQAEWLNILTIPQVLSANAIIYLGITLLRTLELKYFIMKILLENILIAAVLVSFGSVFNWFTSTPVWLLVSMGVVIYFISLLLDLLHMKQEAQEINSLIQNHNKKFN